MGRLWVKLPGASRAQARPGRNLRASGLCVRVAFNSHQAIPVSTRDEKAARLSVSPHKAREAQRG